jgi:hypothetical protein
MTNFRLLQLHSTLRILGGQGFVLVLRRSNFPLKHIFDDTLWNGDGLLLQGGQLAAEF